MFEGMDWFVVSHRAPELVALADRHYSRLVNRGGRAGVDRRKYGCVGPGEKLCLMTTDGRAGLTWRRDIYGAYPGVVCTMFRNEGPLLSSLLIEEACGLAWERWSGVRLLTMVAPGHVRSCNPGYCFKCAGFVDAGRTAKRGLVVLVREASSGGNSNI